MTSKIGGNSSCYIWKQASKEFFKTCSKDIYTVLKMKAGWFKHFSDK